MGTAPTCCERALPASSEGGTDLYLYLFSSSLWGSECLCSSHACCNLSEAYILFDRQIINKRNSAISVQPQADPWNPHMIRVYSRFASGIPMGELAPVILLTL